MAKGVNPFKIGAFDCQGLQYLDGLGFTYTRDYGLKKELEWPYTFFGLNGKIAFGGFVCLKNDKAFNEHSTFSNVLHLL